MSEEKEDKIPKFNGTAEGWTYFSAKFKSVLINKNMRELLKAVRTSGDMIPKYSDDCKVVTRTGNTTIRRPDTAKAKVKEQNAKAFSLLVCNISTQKRPGKMAFDLVLKHQTGGAEGDQGDYLRVTSRQPGWLLRRSTTLRQSRPRLSLSKSTTICA
jgi:hypothetical protein